MYNNKIFSFFISYNNFEKYEYKKILKDMKDMKIIHNILIYIKEMKNIAVLFVKI